AWQCGARKAASERPARRLHPQLALDEAERTELGASPVPVRPGILAAAEAVLTARAARIVGRPVVAHEGDEAPCFELLAVHTEPHARLVRPERPYPADRE